MYIEGFGEEFPAREIDVSKLNEEIATLNLPGFIGVAQLSRRRNEAGIWQRAAKHLIVKCSPLSSVARESLVTVLGSHTP